MTPNTFGLVTGILFLLGALVHIVRLLLGVHVTIGSIVIPFWISWLLVIGCGYLAFEGFKISRITKAQ